MQLELEAQDGRRGDNERRAARERGAALLVAVPYVGPGSLPVPPPDSPVSMADSSDSPPDSPDNVARSLLWSLGQPDAAEGTSQGGSHGGSHGGSQGGSQRRWRGAPPKPAPRSTSAPPNAGSPSERRENPSPGDSMNPSTSTGDSVDASPGDSISGELPHGWEMATDEIGRTYYFRRVSTL